MFLDELVGDFYQELSTDFRASLRFGQICGTPVLYSYEHAELWRASSFDASETQATDFSIISRPSDAYRRSTTIHSPRLEPYEEFPVVRAKFRPVIMLVPDPPEIAIPDLRGGGRINRHLCLVAPCYGVVDAMSKSKYREEFLNRVRCLEFPQFMFLPNMTCMPKDSLLRLDSIQHAFHNQLDPTRWALSPDIQAILRGQLSFLFAGLYDGEYKAARDTLMTQ
jgi:hypothetical protein